MISKYLQLTDVLDNQNKGWLDLATMSDPLIKIPYLTKVGWNKSKRVFSVMNGYYKNYEIDQALFENQYLKYFSEITGEITRGANRLELDTKNQNLIIGDTIIPVKFSENSIQSKYYILAPTITKKQIKADYLNEKNGGSRFAETWFPFVGENDKYPKTFLHFGMFSEGCVLVPYRYNGDGAVWSKVFKGLLSMDYNDITLCEIHIK